MFGAGRVEDRVGEVDQVDVLEQLSQVREGLRVQDDAVGAFAVQVAVHGVDVVGEPVGQGWGDVEAVAVLQARTEGTGRVDVDADGLPGAGGGLSKAGECFGERRDRTVAVRVRVCRGRGVCVIPVRVQQRRFPEHFEGVGVQPDDPVGGVRSVRWPMTRSRSPGCRSVSRACAISGSMVVQGMTASSAKWSVPAEQVSRQELVMTGEPQPASRLADWKHRDQSRP
ncbi:hypothetical protein ACWEO4_47215 [Streptomyces sp. NPDC004393]|uniref:hypothetical protein n=1 Tax=Streptomyces sp. NPDC004533 TaxID=3154278 RepID=UPI0033B084EB